MVEDAQKQAWRSGRKIDDETLLLFGITAMLTTERYPWTNDNWGYQYEDQKTWSIWNISYMRVHDKARDKAQAMEGSNKFGATNAAERILNNREVATNSGGNKVVIKAIEGYFYNVSSTTSNKKSVLDQLVAKNAKIAATNKDLVAIVKISSNENKDLQRYT